MALLGLIGGLTVATVAFMWVLLRLCVFGLKADSTDVTAQYADGIQTAYQTFILVVGVYLILDYGVIDGVVQWLTGTWNMIL